LLQEVQVLLEQLVLNLLELHQKLVGEQLFEQQ